MTYISHNKHNQLIMSTLGFPANENFREKVRMGVVADLKIFIGDPNKFFEDPRLSLETRIFF